MYSCSRSSCGRWCSEHCVRPCFCKEMECSRAHRQMSFGECQHKDHVAGGKSRCPEGVRELACWLKLRVPSNNVQVVPMLRTPRERNNPRHANLQQFPCAFSLTAFLHRYTGWCREFSTCSIRAWWQLFAVHELNNPQCIVSCVSSS